MNKLFGIVIGLVAVGALVVSLVALNERPPLSASSGNEHFNPEYFRNGLLLGNPSQENGGACASTDIDLASIGNAATATIPFTMVAYSTSTPQAFFLGVNTTTDGVADIALNGVTGSSTADKVDVTIQNRRSGAFNVATTTWTLCMIQRN